MSAPISKSQMAFELPQLSYIDTRWEEPAVPATVEPARRHTIANWISALVEGYRAWRVRSRTLSELRGLSDRELMDMGMSRGDFGRMFDDRYNRDLLFRGRSL